MLAELLVRGLVEVLTFIPEWLGWVSLKLFGMKDELLLDRWSTILGAIIMAVGLTAVAFWH
jgi:hypothetical protein